MEKITGHGLDSLAEILWPLMKNGVVICLNGKTVGRYIRGPECTWTQGGGIQIPWKYKIYCRENHKEMIKNKLQKINICFISMSRTLAVKSQHPNGIHKVHLSTLQRPWALKRLGA